MFTLLVTMAALQSVAHEEPTAAPAPSAETMQTGFLFESIDAQDRTYDYAVYVPRDYDHDEATPMILFLHGMGESGENGTHQIGVGLGPHIMAHPEKWPFVVLFPQKPKHQQAWEDHTDALRAMLDATIDTYNIDEDRVFLTGLSQGGHGTWTINAAMPDRFAALASVCGYASRPKTWGSPWPGADDALIPELADAASKIPVRVYHGSADNVVPPAQSEHMVEAIKERGGDVELKLYPRVNHNSWDRAYGQEGIGEWFLGIRRER